MFQTFRDYKQELLLHKVDKEDNTISHIAAANGNSKLFKVPHLNACISILATKQFYKVKGIAIIYCHLATTTTSEKVALWE